MILLLNHQRPMLNHLRVVQHPALYASMRLGKAIVVCVYIDKHTDFKHVLIVGPLSTYGSWIDAVQKTTKDSLFSVIGSKTQKKEALGQVCNHKYVYTNTQIYLTLPEICEFEWDCVIFDESVGLKTPEKLTSKKKQNVTKFFCNNFAHVQKRIILSGYPAPNKDIDYFQQLKFLSPELTKPFKDYYAFRNRAFKEIFPHKYVINKGGKEWLTKKLKECAYFVDYRKANFKHTLTEYIHRFNPDPKLKPIKKQLIENYVIGDKELKTDLQIYHYLRLLSSGLVDGSSISNYRVNELKSFITSNCAEEKILLLVNFHDELNFVKKILKIKHCISGKTKAGEREGILRSFEKSKKDKILLCTTASIAYGANLSFMDTCIFFSLPNNSDHFEQVKLRVISHTNNKGLIVFLICDEFNDHKILKSLKEHKTRYEVLKNAI